MNIFSLIVPNWNQATGIGLLLFAIGILLWFLMSLPFLSFFPVEVKGKIIGSGTFLVVFGLIITFGYSFIEDLIKDTQALVVIGALVFLVGAGIIIFRKG